MTAWRSELGRPPIHDSCGLAPSVYDNFHNGPDAPLSPDLLQPAHALWEAASTGLSVRPRRLHLCPSSRSSATSSTTPAHPKNIGAPVTLCTMIVSIVGAFDALSTISLYWQGLATARVGALTGKDSLFGLR